MNRCYVCGDETGIASTHNDIRRNIYICSGKCETDFILLSELAVAAEGRKTKGLVAYSDMSLFEPIDLGKLEDLLDFEENVTYVLPVCIEAIPAFNYTKILLVQTPHGGGFAPNIENALEFQKVEDAREYMAQLREQYPDYNFQLWSKAALS